MSKTGTISDNYKVNLMKQILDVRYTDLEEEAKLCRQLLQKADADGDTYGYAFANVYLLDSNLAQGNLSACDFYLVRAAFLCRENHYDDLLRIFCNFAGMYYLNLGDEQAALDYYLEGLKAAREMEDYDTESKLLNNIGIGFGARDGWEFAREYFRRALSLGESQADVVNESTIISILSNLAEACQKVGDVGGSKEALVKSEKVTSENAYNQLVRKCSKCVHYMLEENWEKCIREADGIIAQDMLDTTQKYFVYDMCLGVCKRMLQIGKREVTQKFLHILDHSSMDASLINRYRYQCLQIEYIEMYESPEMLQEAYSMYFKTLEQVEKIERKSRVQSMLSQIQLTTVLIEREEMKGKIEELELVGQLDELTGLYNRRHLNKQISKMEYDNRIKMVGVVMIDVDCFKEYNDFYDHFKGDIVLKSVAAALTEAISADIFVSRYGGDEFVCICTNLVDEQVECYIKNVCSAMEKKAIKHEKSSVAPFVTLSLGYCNESVEKGVNEIMLAADQALYQAKQGGRNQFSKRVL